MYAYPEHDGQGRPATNFSNCSQLLPTAPNCHLQVHTELADRGLPHEGLQGWQLDKCRKMWIFVADQPDCSPPQFEVGHWGVG